jgi:hypothetical protein
MFDVLNLLLKFMVSWIEIVFSPFLCPSFCFSILFCPAPLNIYLRKKLFPSLENVDLKECIELIFLNLGFGERNQKKRCKLVYVHSSWFVVTTSRRNVKGILFHDLDILAS